MTTDNKIPTPASPEELNIARKHFWTGEGLVDDVWSERERQLKKWGLQERPSGTDANKWVELELVAKRIHDEKVKGEDNPEMPPLTWLDILREEVYEAFAEEDPDALRVELVQVMAVAASWILDLDRRGDL